MAVRAGLEIASKTRGVSSSHKRRKRLGTCLRHLPANPCAAIAWRTGFILGVLLLSVALVACGESSQDKAKAEVCDARAEISKQINKLQGLTPSSNAITEAKSGFEVIGRELKKIKDAQPDLASARKEQVEPAMKTFESELGTIASSVLAGISSGGVESALKAQAPKLKSALSALANSYKQALAPINCS